MPATILIRCSQPLRLILTGEPGGGDPVRATASLRGYPALLNGSVSLGLFSYPIYRLAIIAVGLIVAVALALFITRTRIGMLVRAGGHASRYGAGAGCR